MTTEQEFLDAYSPEPFGRPSIAVDIALVTVIDDALWALVIRRDEHPHRGKWQLPGGFVHINESLDEAATRVLAEKSGVRDVYTEQLYTFGDVNRDPRTRVITVAYYALVASTHLTTQGVTGSMARIEVPWKGETGGPVRLQGNEGQFDTAFDHDQIIGMAVKRLRGKLNYAPVGYELLPGEFTLLDLQRIHEAILGIALNKDSFRRRMLASDDLEPTGNHQTDVGHRPAALYRHKAGTP